MSEDVLVCVGDRWESLFLMVTLGNVFVDVFDQVDESDEGEDDEWFEIEKDESNCCKEFHMFNNIIEIK